MKNVLRVICCVLCISVFFVSLTPAMMAQGANEYSWTGSWSTSPVNAGVKLASVRITDFLLSTTVRSVLQVTLGGGSIRLKFSNLYGSSPLTINETSVARTNIDDETLIIDGTAKSVTFNNGETSVTIPAGKDIYSDPVDFSVVALEKISVSYYVKSFTGISTAGLYGARSYTSSGNQVSKTAMPGTAHLRLSSGTITYYSIPFLTNVDVDAPGAYSIVFFGDSTLTNQSPYYLAEMLIESGVKNVGVLQQGIIANRLLHDGDGVSLIGLLYGDAGIKRFERDVIAQTGVKKVFVKIGLNDILHPMTKSMAGKAPYSSVEDITTGYEKLINRAHEAGLEIYFFGRSAWKGYSRDFLFAGPDDLVWTDEAEEMLRDLNKWIINDSAADGYIDVEKMRDKQDIYSLKPEYTTDGAHFSELGSRVLIDLIPPEYLNLQNKERISITKLYDEGKGGKIYSSLPQQKSPGASENITEQATTPLPAQPIQPQNQTPTPTNQTPSETDSSQTEAQGADSGSQITQNANQQQAEPVNHLTPDGDTGQSVQGLSKAKRAGIMLLCVLSLGAFIWLSIYVVNKRKYAQISAGASEL